MAIEGWEIIRLELKYCERCGGLWLRQRGVGGVYCAGCSSELPTFPLCGRRISRPRLPNHGNFEAPRDGVGQSAGNKWRQA